MKRNAQPLRFRLVRQAGPRAVFVNEKTPPPEAQPGAPVAGPQSPRFVPDGMIYPRPNAQFFDVAVRSPQLAAATTVTQDAFEQEERIKAGWIRGLGYGFNNPHGFFQVRTTLLINNAPPANYIFKTVDASAPATYEGSFPPAQIGTLQNPTNVFVWLPANALVQIRYVNNATSEAFAAIVRLTGWSFGN